MILIFARNLSSRLSYVFELIFAEIAGVSVNFTNDEERFSSYIGAKLHYGKQQLDNELFIYAENILFEKGIKSQQFDVGEYRNIKSIFWHNHPHSVLPFDPFAAAFYLVSRYEEYNAKNLDAHGRFSHQQSVAFQQQFLQKPVINIWTAYLMEILQKKYPNLQPQARNYHFMPTYDIDMAFAYRHKGFLRNFGAMLKDLSRFKFSKVRRRLGVQFFGQKDPFSTYAFQIELQKKYNLSPIYFFLIGQFSNFDKNIPIDSQPFRDLIQSIADYAKVGIHPSYYSGDDEKMLKREILELSEVIKRSIRRSRQHYIRLRIPQTYQQLLKNEIQKDYSMGYASRTGFRASIASSFLFYDISQEQTTNLRIYPFVAMDVTLKEYMNLDAKKAVKVCRNLNEEVRRVNGLFSIIFHNHTLSETEGWEGWQQAYEQIINKASRQKEEI